MYSLCQRIIQEGRWDGGILYMKKRWGTPRAVVEEFEANEYVAACYNIKCNVNAANSVEMEWRLNWWESNYENGQTHAADRCGSYGSYYVIDDNNDGVFDRMIEKSPDLGELSCTLYTNAKYNDQGSWNGIHSGDYIYWTTSSGNRTWHHQGSVAYQDTAHPNRS